MKTEYYETFCCNCCRRELPISEKMDEERTKPRIYCKECFAVCDDGCVYHPGEPNL